MLMGKLFFWVSPIDPQTPKQLEDNLIFTVDLNNALSEYLTSVKEEDVRFKLQFNGLCTSRTSSGTLSIHNKHVL
jgi:hypothetical protein